MRLSQVTVIALLPGTSVLWICMSCTGMAQIVRWSCLIATSLPAHSLLQINNPSNTAASYAVHPLFLNVVPSAGVSTDSQAPLDTAVI